MNKYFNSLIIVSHALLFTPAIAITHTPAPFVKLAPDILKNALPWAQDVLNTLNKDQQLAYLNFFALLNSGEYTTALIKCAEYIESQVEMHPSSQLLSANTMQPLNSYYENCQEKISRKKNITPTEEESLWQKLEIKIQELLAYINGIYYKTLYGSMAKKNPSSLMYMFDENGVIPQEKRTKSLPQPE
jgi:hypothetical protein